MAAIALMGDINNSRKRGRSPPLEDECTPISKRIAVLSLDGSLASKIQSQQNVSNHLPHQMNFGGDYSHSSSSVQQNPLVHQQEGYGQVQVQHNMGIAGLPYSAAIHPHQNSLGSHHLDLMNHQQVPNQNGGALPGAGGDMLRNFPYRPDIQNSPYYTENEVLYYSYLERTQRHGRTLHPSFYSKE